jgi:hypothetical protein
MSWIRVRSNAWSESERQRFNGHAIGSLELSPIEVAYRVKFR